jgi:hypothetical protein
MKHLSEEELILDYYAEEALSSESAQHLETCAECRALSASLRAVWEAADAVLVPDRGAGYGAWIWSRLQPEIASQRRPGRLAGRWAVAVAASLAVAVFLAGRFYPLRQTTDSDLQARQGILRLAVGDYLDRSQIVLTELANAEAKVPLDIASEQQRAADLVVECRLYRQTAIHIGDERVAALLEDLERVLLQISHAPSPLPPHELVALREQLRSDGILFKIRVLGSVVRTQESAGDAARSLAPPRTL